MFIIRKISCLLFQILIPFPSSVPYSLVPRYGLPDYRHTSWLRPFHRPLDVLIQIQPFLYHPASTAVFSLMLLTS